MNVEEKLREMLLPVFNLDSVEEVNLGDSLVKDLEADSLDFVEIIHLIDRTFGVQITTNEILVGGKPINTENLFNANMLTLEGAKILTESFENKKDQIREGMNKIELFSLLTVEDLANIIQTKMEGKE